MVDAEVVRFEDQEILETSGLTSTEKSDLEELDDVKVSHEKLIQHNEFTDAEGGDYKKNKTLNSKNENSADKKDQSGAQVHGTGVGSNHFIKAAQQISQYAGKSSQFPTEYKF